MFCHHCGKTIHEGKFCYHCGKGLLSHVDSHHEEKTEQQPKKLSKSKFFTIIKSPKIITLFLLLIVFVGSIGYGLYNVKAKFNEKDKIIEQLRSESDQLLSQLKTAQSDLAQCNDELGNTKGDLDSAKNETEKANQSAQKAETKASLKEQEANKNKQLANQKALEAQKANTQFNVCAYYLDLAKELSVLLGNQKSYYKSSAGNIASATLEFLNENYNIAQYYMDLAKDDMANAEYYETKVQNILNQFE